MGKFLPDLSGLELESGNYCIRLIKVIGQGAHGSVYLAEDLNTPDGALEIKYYAVKCKRTHKQEDHKHSQALQDREIAMHAPLSSLQCVVTLHHVIRHEGYLFMIMDLCEGGDLVSAILERRFFANNSLRIKRAFIQILDAVQACHDAGVYHRDLKPENILCSSNDTVFKLSDFGLATSNETSFSYGCGSGYYMAPECLVDDVDATTSPYSTRETDVWALGIILLYILTSQRPWNFARTDYDYSYRQYTQHGWSYLQQMCSISRDAAQVLSRMLDPVPHQRLSIPEVRDWVEGIETFFLEEETVSWLVRVQAASAAVKASGEFTEIELTRQDKVPTSLRPIISSSKLKEDVIPSAQTSAFVGQAGPDSSCTSLDIASSGPSTPTSLPLDAREAPLVDINDRNDLHASLPCDSKLSAVRYSPMGLYEDEVFELRTAGMFVHRIVQAIHRFASHQENSKFKIMYN